MLKKYTKSTLFQNLEELPSSVRKDVYILIWENMTCVWHLKNGIFNNRCYVSFKSHKIIILNGHEITIWLNYLPTNVINSDSFLFQVDCRIIYISGQEFFKQFSDRYIFKCDFAPLRRCQDCNKGLSALSVIRQEFVCAPIQSLFSLKCIFRTLGWLQIRENYFQQQHKTSCTFYARCNIEICDVMLSRLSQTKNDENVSDNVFLILNRLWVQFSRFKSIYFRDWKGIFTHP